MKHITHFRALFCTLLLAAAALTLTACGGKTIDLSDYIETDVKGLNGHAAVTCDLDYDALYAAIASQQESGGSFFTAGCHSGGGVFSHYCYCRSLRGPLQW